MTQEFFKDPLGTRKAMAADRHRPKFHFLPPRNWMNDPNGLIQWQGRTHLFYQFNPYGANWGFIHWGHASSDDLIHWQDHPLALKPEAHTGDENGCFSGCVVVDDGTPTAVYTGFKHFTDTPVMLARSEDPDLITWEKNPHNPVIAGPPEGVTATDFRDPYVWREGERWRAVIGAGLENGKSAALLYESADLIHWQYLGHLYAAQTLESSTMWECPNFFPLGDHYVLLVSLFPQIQGVYYYVGDYDGQRFVPEAEGFLEDGKVFYAPQVRQFDDGRTLLFAWLLEGRSDECCDEAGWAGVQAMPRELWLDEQLQLCSRPISEAASLRQSSVQLPEYAPTADALMVKQVGSRIEIDTVFSTDVEGVLALSVLMSPEGEEVTRLGCDLASGEVFLDTTRSSTSVSAEGVLQTRKLALRPNEDIRLHALIDSSVIEVWCNDVSLSGRAYPTRPDSVGVRVYCSSGLRSLVDLQIWEMSAIWPVDA